MESQELISIIIPAYNAEPFLSNCLESIISQTYSFFEVLIVENGSNDETLSLANSFVLKDKRFRVFKNHEKGAAKARNFGINNSKGDYLTFIDADDKISPCFLETLMKGVRLNNADICACSMIGSLEVPTSFYDLSKREDRKNALKFFNGATCCKLYARSAINKIRYDSIAIGEDPLFNLKIISQNITVQYIKYSGYYYLENNSSTTSRVDESIMDEIFHCNFLGFEFIQNQEKLDIDLYRYWLSYSIQNILIYNKKISKNSKLSIRKNLVIYSSFYEKSFSINFKILKLLGLIPIQSIRNISLRILMYYNSLKIRINYPFLEILKLYKSKIISKKNEHIRVN